MIDPEATGIEQQMFQIYRPADSSTTYAIRLTSNGALIFDSSTGKRTFVDGKFETIHEAMGVFFLRRGQVNRGYGELSMGIFDLT